ncbi:MAG: hypothetical protein AAAB35_02025 [Phyllobacterium sp.]|uniref:hypothetical protein n=1 Tax=Phyllobacterium sp. TaxID=1871046 RepID=UPI0030F115CE
MKNNPTQTPVQETANEARQGPPGRPVLNILVIGLLLAIVAWGAAELYGQSTDDATRENNQSTVAPPQTPENAPVVNAPQDSNPAPQTGSGGPSQTNNPNGTQ